MITSLEIKDLDGTAVPWLGKSKTFQNQRIWEFGPGLNILWGANGSGKSCIIALLARMFHCEQGKDEQKLTYQSRLEVFGSYGSPRKAYEAVHVEHDGSPCVLFDPKAPKGQSLPGSFDDDFMLASVGSYMAKGSSGELNINRLVSVLDMLTGRKAYPTFDFGKYGLDSETRTILDPFLKGTIPTERPTILMDEPDMNLDVTNQRFFWGLIARAYKLAEKPPQIIVATHSLLACNLDFANHIRVDPTYLDICRDTLAKLH